MTTTPITATAHLPFGTDYDMACEVAGYLHVMQDVDRVIAKTIADNLVEARRSAVTAILKLIDNVTTIDAFLTIDDSTDADDASLKFDAVARVARAKVDSTVSSNGTAGYVADVTARLATVNALIIAAR